MALLGLAGLAFASQARSADTLELGYRLTLSHPTAHLLAVEITAGHVTSPALDFQVPAWSPGRYAIYDFAKNVQEFEARGDQGQALPWTQLDKQTWRVVARGAGGIVRVKYRVFANDLNGTFSQFDTSHANVNGASVFMSVVGHKPDPLTLSVELPEDARLEWKVWSGFSRSPQQRTFQVENYDRLIDTPLEFSPACSADEFQEAGKTFRVVVHSYPEVAQASAIGGPVPAPRQVGVPPEPGRSKLLDGLKKIVRSEMATMPAPDFEHYTFIFHFAPEISLGDAMEHRNSTQVIVRGSLGRGAAAPALEDAAHEFFHVWNVKRLRPVGLGPFDYTRETYTSSLWFAEGITSYYADVHLLRAGLWTRQQFLERLGEQIHELESEPGRKLMSAESSSFHAWFYDRSPQMQETNFANTTISYYNKGLILGMLLDLEIRARTNGQKSLDDVLRLLYRKFYQQPPSSYYGPGAGYQERDILEAVNAVSGSDFTSFFERYVEGTDSLPYGPTLARAGLELRVAPRRGAPPSLGILTQRQDRGLRIVAVEPGGAADRAGLSRDDLLLAVDSLSLEATELEERLTIYPPGAEIALTLERHGKEDTVTVKLNPPPNAFAIVEAANPIPTQLAIRTGWLR